MRIKLIKIGNSKGVRLPKAVLKECQFQEELELQVYKKTVLLTAVHPKRQEWSDLIRQSVEPGNDFEEDWQW